LDLDSLVAHAGSVGLIAGALLLVIGINWVGALRGCLRAVWEKEQHPGNPFLLKFKDAVVLVGLGAVELVAIGSSVFANSAVGWAADKAGIEGGAGRSLSGRQAGKDFRTVDEGAGHIGQASVVGAGVAAQRCEQG
jgi:membrane protein